MDLLEFRVSVLQSVHVQESKIDISYRTTTKTKKNTYPPFLGMFKFLPAKNWVSWGGGGRGVRGKW